MRKLIIYSCAMVLILGLSFESNASIIWDWNFDTEAGQFLTTGDLVVGTVAAGTYDLLDFSVSSTAAGGSNYEGSISDGTWSSFGGATPYELVWDGTGVTEWGNSTSDPGWSFQNAVGAGQKRYYFGLNIQAFDNTADINSLYDSAFASLIAAEVAPPPPGRYVAEGNVTVSPSGINPVPEPATIILLGTGLLGLVGLGRKKILKK